MLKSEGYWMNNCSRDYTRQCQEFEYCIFSIRKRTGERLATLGIANDRGSWSFDQCYGPSNLEVLEETCEYLDEDEVLVNMQESSEIKQFSDRKLPSKMVMSPVDEPGHQTIIEILENDFNVDINESFFSQQNMKKIR